MSPSVNIIPRPVKGGTSYHVRYRLGGRETRPLHGGAFKTLKEARARRDWIAGEIAAMRVPDLSRLAPPEPPRTLAIALDEFADGQLHVGSSAQRTYKKTAAKLGRFGRMPVEEITPADVNAWIATIAHLAPATIAAYIGPVRQTLDREGIRPNPARDAWVKLPSIEAEETDPPNYREFLAICEAITPRHRFTCEFIERTGLRFIELRRLGWEDIDLPGRRIRVAQRTKGSSAGRRFVPLTELMVAALDALTPPEDRIGLVFPDARHSTFGQAIGRACRRAKVPEYGPHDLRHRYISLLVLAGIPISLVRQIAGHSKASMTLDVYSHVLLDEPEWRQDELRRGVAVVSGLTERATENQESLDMAGGETTMGSTGIEPSDPSQEV